MCTKREALQIIQEYEWNGTFNKPVEDHSFMPVKMINSAKDGFKNFFILRPFCNKISKKICKVRVEGRKNLKGIKNAIITCNHVSELDAFVAIYGLKGHRVHIADNTLAPSKKISERVFKQLSVLRLENAENKKIELALQIESLLKKNNYVMFYPEESMWIDYQKPRPFNDYAFNFATANKTPIIPLYITFTPTGKRDEEYLPVMSMTLHIMKPVYPNKDFDFDQNVKYLKETVHEQYVSEYENFYGMRLVYDTKKRFA